MREIKFRAWDKVNKQMWNDAQECKEPSENLQCGTCFGDFLKPNNDWEVMQFTGLKDKNGVEIYEGDLIKANDESTWHLSDDEISFGIVVFHYSSWGLQDIEDKDDGCDFNLFAKDGSDFEVIGNIYEHAELLK